jgi:hypothetical protein
LRFFILVWLTITSWSRGVLIFYLQLTRCEEFEAFSSDVHFDILCKGVTKFELTNNKNSCLSLLVHSLIGVLSG